MSDNPHLSISHEELLGEVANEFFSALSRGEQPSISEFAHRYPAIADVIESTFPALAMIDSPREVSDFTSELGTLKQPKALGDFQIIREIGRGGMGVVYEAEQLSMGRRVALKILPLAAMLDEHRLERFNNEVRAAATLDHPHCVPIYAVGKERGVHYYAMKLIRGHSLADVVEQLSSIDNHVDKLATVTQINNGNLTPISKNSSHVKDIERSPQVENLSISRNSRKQDYYCKIATLAAQAADALHHAHERGIVHRDIKPSNLMLDTSGKIWITDFGLARIEAEAGVTMTGDLLGTLRYMSPEQALGKQALIDNRVDIYSLGSTIYELLALKPAVTGEDRAQILRDYSDKEPTSLRKLDSSIPVELETIVGKAIEKRPSDRYATAQDMADDFRRFLEFKPILAKRSTVIGRTVKWVHRYPAVTALAVALLLSMAAIALGAMWHAHRLASELEVNKILRITAESQQAQTRRLKYLSDMRLANISMHDGLPGEAGKLLELYRSPSTGVIECDFPWYYLWQKYQDSHRRFLGHTKGVPTFAIAKKSDLLISGSHDKTVRLFNRKDNSQLAQITGFAGNVNAVVLGHEEKLLFTGADMGDLAVWDISDISIGGEPKKIKSLTGHSKDVLCLAISPNGKYLASAGADEKVLIWDSSSLQQVYSLEGHAGNIRCLDYSPDGSTLASISHDNYLILWDLNTGQERQRIKITAKDHQLGLAVCFHPSGDIIFTGNSHGEVRSIRVEDGITLSKFIVPLHWIRSLDCSDDGRTLAVAGNDPFIRLLRVNSRFLLKPWHAIPGHSQQTWQVEFGKSKSRLYSSGTDNSIAVREIRKVGLVTETKTSNKIDPIELILRRLSFSKLYNKILLADKNRFRLYSTNDLHNPIELNLPQTSSWFSGAISPDSKWICGLQNKVLFSNLHQPSQINLLHFTDNKSPELQYTSASFNPIKKSMAVGTSNGKVVVIKIPSLGIAETLEPFGDSRVTDVQFTSDGQYLAACYCNRYETYPSTTVIWETQSLNEIARIEGTYRLLTAFPQSNKLVLTHRDQSISTWDIDNQKAENHFRGHIGKVISGDISPDEKYLLTSAESDPIKLWSLESGRLVLDLHEELQVPHVLFTSANSAVAAHVRIVSKTDYQYELVPLLDINPQDKKLTIEKE